MFYARKENHIILSGQTYPHRETIKALGGMFDGQTKNWRLLYSESVLKKVVDLCDGEKLSQEETGTPKDWTLSELMTQVGSTVEGRFKEPLWIVGEIQNLSIKSQAIFLQLAEGTSSDKGNSLSISAKLWSQVSKAWEQKGLGSLESLLQEGLQIRCYCQVHFYKARGQISLTILDVDPRYTQGLLALAREELWKSLQARGLAEANRRLPMPWCLWKVGVISAEGSRALGDFTHQLLEEGYFPGTLVVALASSQGEGVVQQVPLALKALVEAKVDIIVLTRGGGSQADLRWFDTPQIAEAIAHCPIPVISAIGHHEDTCIAEMISWQRCKTPTAAAEFVLSRWRLVLEHLDKVERSLYKLARESWLESYQKYQRLAAGIFFQSLEALSSASRLLSEKVNLMEQKSFECLTFQDNLLELKNAALKSRDLQPWIERGWTQLLRKSEGLEVIRKAESLTQGESLWARFPDGKVHLIVEKIEIKREKS